MMSIESLRNIHSQVTQLLSSATPITKTNISSLQIALKNIFNEIAAYSDGANCSNLDINTLKSAFTPSRVIKETCRVLISDFSVKMITEFYAGYSGPNFHALFLTKDYTISFIIQELWREHPEFSGADGFDKQETFAKRIFNEEFSDITERIERLKSILKIVRLVQV